MSYPLINGAQINGTDAGGLQRAAGVDLVGRTPPRADLSFGAQLTVATLEFGGGAIKSGTDVAAAPYYGLEMVRSDGFISLMYGQPNADTVFAVATSAALEIGQAAVASAFTANAKTLGVLLDTGSASASRTVKPATDAGAMEIGAAGPVQRVAYAQTSVVIEFGAASVEQYFGARGVDLMRSTPPRLFLGGGSFQALTSTPFEIGAVGWPTMTARARTHVALEIGRASVSRGASC